jgi:hypothetical protein
VLPSPPLSVFYPASPSSAAFPTQPRRDVSPHTCMTLCVQSEVSNATKGTQDEVRQRATLNTSQKAALLTLVSVHSLTTPARARPRRRPSQRRRSAATTATRCVRAGLKSGELYSAPGSAGGVLVRPQLCTHLALHALRPQEEPSRGGDDASDEDGEPKAAAIKAGKAAPSKAKGKAKKKGKDDWSDDDDTPRKPQAGGGGSEVRSQACLFDASTLESLHSWRSTQS